MQIAEASEKKIAETNILISVPLFLITKLNPISAKNDDLKAMKYFMGSCF